MGGVRVGRGCGWCDSGEGLWVVCEWGEVVGGVRVGRGCGWCESGEWLWMV